MLQKNVNDLLVFLTIAKEKSFTKAASKLGVSQSALSHTMRNLEANLKVKLLLRTTRSVKPTKLGEILLKNIAPRLEEIVEELNKVTDLKQRPMGQINLITDEHAANFVIWPHIRKFLKFYPDIKFNVEVSSDLQKDIRGHYDAKIGLEEVVDKDYLSRRISQPIQVAVVASPLYLQNIELPRKPKDLIHHQSVGCMLSFMKNAFDWEFIINEKKQIIRMESQFTCNTLTQALQATLEGFGFAYVPIKEVCHAIQQKHLIHILPDYTPSFTGYHLQYPNRRSYTQAFTLFLKSFENF